MAQAKGSHAPHSEAFQKRDLMKTLMKSVLVAFTCSAGAAIGAPASSTINNELVNAYGEPAGFGNLPDVEPRVGFNPTNNLIDRIAQPGTNGMYLLPGNVDHQSFASLGQRQARAAAAARGTVTIGQLEVLDSGPTGPLDPDALHAARDEVTQQVLGRIKATDRVMRSLEDQAKSLDEDDRTRFKAAAAEVAQQRAALRESLRVVRATDGDAWTNARTAVSVNFNAYVQSMHRAEAAATGATS